MVIGQLEQGKSSSSNLFVTQIITVLPDLLTYHHHHHHDHQGVVHVAINYRLGALGFTALEGEAWGNQGLRDQVVGIF